MAIRAILFLICVASLVQASVSSPKRFSHGKTLFCYLSASESGEAVLLLDTITSESCTHYILNTYTFRRDTFEIFFIGGTMNLHDWRTNLLRFRNEKVLMELYWADISSEHLRRIPNDLGATWVQLLMQYGLSGIIIRIPSIDRFTNLPNDENIQYLLRHVYGEFQRKNMLLILEDYSCLVGTSLRTIEVDYLISNCEIQLDKCVHDKYIESSPENIKFTNFHDIPNSKIIREFIFLGRRYTRFNDFKSTYSETCDKILSKNASVENVLFCLKTISYYTSHSQNSLQTIVFHDTETITKHIKYFVSSGINGILLRKRDLDDAENQCKLNDKQIVPGTWGRHPLLKAVTIGILQGAIDEWMKKKVDEEFTEDNVNLRRTTEEHYEITHDKMVICQELGIAKILTTDPAISNYCTHIMLTEDYIYSTVTPIGMLYSAINIIEKNIEIIPIIKKFKQETNLTIIFEINIPVEAGYPDDNMTPAAFTFAPIVANIIFENYFDGFCYSYTDQGNKYKKFTNFNYMFSQIVRDQFDTLDLSLMLRDKLPNESENFRNLHTDSIIYNFPIEFENCMDNSFASDLEKNLIYCNMNHINLSDVLIKMSWIYNPLHGKLLGNYSFLCNSIFETIDRCNNMKIIIGSLDESDNIASLNDAVTLMKQAEYFGFHGVKGIFFEGFDRDDTIGVCKRSVIPELNGPYPLLRGINEGLKRGIELKKAVGN